MEKTYSEDLGEEIIAQIKELIRLLEIKFGEGLSNGVE
jgi:hypothetical protein